MTGVFAGIDLGTNNSCIAIYKYEKVEVLAGADGSRITPSYVFVDKDENFQVGKSAKNYGHKQPDRLCYDSKRLLGTKANDPLCKLYKSQWTFDIKRDIETGYCNYKIDGKIYSPEEISAEVLKKLISYVPEKIEGVVLTVPAYFSSEQKKKILDAADMAKLNVLQLICEPTAAAIAYGMEHSYINGEILFVFDLGGGTFDITIIQIVNSKEFEVIALGGDPHLGGRDFDYVIIEWMLKELKKQVNGIIELTSRKKYKMTEMAKEAKEALSQAEDAVIQLSEIHTDATDITLTRKAFEELSSKLLERIKESIIHTLKCKSVSSREINHVLFVGGASKMPMIATLLKQFFNEAKFSKTVNAEEIVALGATRMAAKLGKKSNRSEINSMKIQDIVPLMIGLEIYKNGIATFEKIFDNNSKYGEKKTVMVKTTVDDQKKANIDIYEGHSYDLEKNKYIGSLTFDIPVLKAGEYEVPIDFEINKNGILDVNLQKGGIPCNVRYNTQLRPSTPSSQKTLIT